jgi:hypothetical protein
MTVTGCLHLVSKSGTAATGATDGNTVVDSRFELTGAERRDNVPADTGGSANAGAAMSRTYHLAAIESQLSPFVDATVEVSGEIPAALESTVGGGHADAAGRVRAEVVRKVR